MVGKLSTLLFHASISLFFLLKAPPKRPLTDCPKDAILLSRESMVRNKRGAHER